MGQAGKGDGVKCERCNRYGYFKYALCKQCRERDCVDCGKKIWSQDMTRVLCMGCIRVRYGRREKRTKLERFDVK